MHHPAAILPPLPAPSTMPLPSPSDHPTLADQIANGVTENQGPGSPEHPVQREDLAKSDSLWEETNLTGIWAGTTALFIDGKLFARVRALWGPLKMFGRPQSQKLCVLRKGLWALRKFSSQKAPSRSRLREKCGKVSIQRGRME